MRRARTLGRPALVAAASLMLVGAELRAQSASDGAAAEGGSLSFGAEAIVTIPGEELADFADSGIGAAPFLEYAPSPAWRLVGRLEVAVYDGEIPEDRDWTTFSVTGGVAYDLLGGDPSTELSLGLSAGLVIFDPHAPTRDTPSPVETDARPAGAAGLRFVRFLSRGVGLRLSGTVTRTLPGDDVAGPDSSWLTSLGAGVVVRP